MSLHDHGYTGGLYEEEVLGRCTTSYRGHLTWQAAAGLAIKSQPKSPASTARRLTEEVSRALGGPVRFFTAVGSPFDYFHGVDGFFVFSGTIVTIDLTRNPNKDCGKADLIVGPEDLKNSAELASRIAREFRTKRRRSA